MKLKKVFMQTHFFLFFPKKKIKRNWELFCRCCCCCCCCCYVSLRLIVMNEQKWCCCGLLPLLLYICFRKLTDWLSDKNVMFRHWSFSQSVSQSVYENMCIITMPVNHTIVTTTKQCHVLYVLNFCDWLLLYLPRLLMLW
jgi:hypothetical protein